MHTPTTELQRFLDTHGIEHKHACVSAGTCMPHCPRGIILRTFRDTYYSEPKKE